MFCDSLCHHAMACPRGVAAPAPIPAPIAAHAPYEGVFIVAIICVTILLLALIIKCILTKRYESQKGAGPDDTENQEKERRFQKKYSLVDKLLSFQESVAKNGSKNKEEENLFRTTIEKYIQELSDPAKAGTGSDGKQEQHG